MDCTQSGLGVSWGAEREGRNLQKARQEARDEDWKPEEAGQEAVQETGGRRLAAKTETLWRQAMKAEQEADGDRTAGLEAGDRKAGLEVGYREAGLKVDDGAKGLEAGKTITRLDADDRAAGPETNENRGPNR